jgi:hypothetical protein
MITSKFAGFLKSPLPWLIIIMIITAGAFYYFAQKTPSVSDAIGYEHAGKQLSLGYGPTYSPPNPWLSGPYFSTYAFHVSQANDTRMHLGFPPGLPLLLAAAVLITRNVNTLPYVVPLIAIVSLFFSYLLGKSLSEKTWIGFWTVVILISLPTFWYFSTSSWSEVPSMAFILIGSVLYFGSHQPKLTTNKRALLSLLGGFFLSYSLYIRYTNALFLPAFFIYEILAYRKDIFKNKEQWPFWIVTGLGIISIPMFNFYYYGGVFTTSYSTKHGWYPNPAFSLKYALGPSFVSGYSLAESLKTLWDNFSLLLLLAPIGWIYLKKKGLFLAVATCLPIFLYSTYAFAPTGINSRFLIPTFPFLSIAIAAALWIFWQTIHKTIIKWVILLLFLVFLFREIPQEVHSLTSRNFNSGIIAELIKETVSFSDENAVFLSYTFNDEISVFGNRSVLNFRRIPPADPISQTYDFEALEPCLVYIIEKLQVNNVSVYYVGHDNFWDIKTKIENHFELQPVEVTSPISIYQIKISPGHKFGQGACPDQTW